MPEAATLCTGGLQPRASSLQPYVVQVLEADFKKLEAAGPAGSEAPLAQLTITLALTLTDPNLHSNLHPNLHPNYRPHPSPYPSPLTLLHTKEDQKNIYYISGEDKESLLKSPSVETLPTDLGLTLITDPNP